MTRRRIGVLALAVLSCLAAAPAARAGRPDGGAQMEDVRAFFTAPLRAALWLYGKAKAARGASCPMLPSDSAFARQALARHGAFWGTLMTADRLHRCGHDLSHYPTVVVGGRVFHADPVEDAWPFR